MLGRGRREKLAAFQPRKRADDRARRRAVIGVADVSVERSLAQPLRQGVPSLRESVADRVSWAPHQAADEALERALAIVEADRSQMLGSDHRPDRLRSANAALQ